MFITDPGVGTLYAPNTTPDKETGLGNWTDDEIARAVREGVAKDGHALFPIMPYPNFRHMSDEDLASVIVYIRSIPAIRNPIAKTRNLNDDDLKAIWAFVHNLKPIRHQVDNTIAPAMCPLCGYRHGLGNTNRK